MSEQTPDYFAVNAIGQPIAAPPPAADPPANPFATDAAPPAAPDAPTPEQSATGQPDGAANDRELQERITRAEAEAEQYRAAAEQERQRVAAYERQLAQQAAQAWRDQEAAVYQQAQNEDDPARAAQIMAEHYRQREQFLIQQNQQSQAQVHYERLNAYADHIIRDQGLDEGDRQRLLSAAQVHPNEMLAEATRIKTQRAAHTSELDNLRAEIEALKRSQQAQTMQQSGAWRAGGAGAPAAPGPRPVPGSDEHLWSLVPELRGR